MSTLNLSAAPPPPPPPTTGATLERHVNLTSLVKFLIGTSLLVLIVIGCLAATYFQPGSMIAGVDPWIIIGIFAALEILLGFLFLEGLRKFCLRRWQIFAFLIPAILFFYFLPWVWSVGITLGFAGGAAFLVAAKHGFLKLAILGVVAFAVVGLGVWYGLRPASVPSAVEEVQRPTPSKQRDTSTPPAPTPPPTLANDGVTPPEDDVEAPEDKPAEKLSVGASGLRPINDGPAHDKRGDSGTMELLPENEPRVPIAVRPPTTLAPQPQYRPTELPMPTPNNPPEPLSAFPGYRPNQACREALYPEAEAHYENLDIAKFDLLLTPGCFSTWYHIPRSWIRWRIQPKVPNGGGWVAVRDPDMHGVVGGPVDLNEIDKLDQYLHRYPSAPPSVQQYQGRGEVTVYRVEWTRDK